jgi:hypothetical protein
MTLLFNVFRNDFCIVVTRVTDHAAPLCAILPYVKTSESRDVGCDPMSSCNVKKSLVLMLAMSRLRTGDFHLPASDACCYNQHCCVSHSPLFESISLHESLWGSVVVKALHY